MEDKGDILYIVMPAYNEGENIRGVVESWIKILDDKPKQSRLVVADSGSTDDTHKILLSLKKKHKNLEILEKTNQYHGPKVIALYNYAVKKRAKFIFQTDSDGQTDPAEFEKFWAERNNSDAIIGYRSKRGDGKIRVLVEKVVCLLLRLFFSVSVPDANAPFRLMKSSLVKKYLDKMPEDYDLPNIILTAYFVRFKERVLFKEISFKPRTAGKNSVNIRKIFKIGRESLFAFAHFRKNMNKEDPDTPKKNARRRIGSVAIVASFVIMALVAVSTSPSSPWNRSETVTDSGVFLTVGTQMKNGLTPYVDTFDHKGPLLYIINYLGVMIDGTSGILVFEFIAIFLSAVYIYKIANLRVKKRWVCVFLTFVSLSLYLALNSVDRGNIAEEYAMPFIAASLYVFLKYYSKGSTSLLSVFLVGVCFSCVSLLRLNMVALWVGFAVAILIKLIAERKIQELFKFIIAFVIGVGAVFLPMAIWLVSTGAFQSFIDAYIIFNLGYSKTNAGHIIDTMLYFLKENVIFFSFALSFYFVFTNIERGENDRIISLVFLVAYILEFLASCMSGYNFPHYGIVLVPLTVFPFSMLFQQIDKDKNVSIVLSMFLLLLVYPVWINGVNIAITSFHNRNEGEVIAEPILKACEYVERNTDPSETIAVYGNLDYLYLKCNRMPASRYSYQYPIVGVRPEIIDEFFEDVLENRPKVFIVQGGYNNKRVNDFLEKSDYVLEWAEENPDENGMQIYSLK